MKILIYGVNYFPEPVGIGKYTSEMAEMLSLLGHDVSIIASCPYFPEWVVKNNCYRSEFIKGVKVQRCPIWVPKNPSGLKRILHLLSFSITSFPLLISRVFVNKPQIIICIAPSIFCAPGTLLFSKLCGNKTKSWLHIQDLEIDAAFDLGLIKGSLFKIIAKLFERTVYFGFDKISTISNAMLEKILIKGIQKNKTTLFSNWVNLQKINAIPIDNRSENIYRKDLKIDEKVIILMYSGSMNQKQNFRILINAIKKLSDEKNILWILAGEGPSKKFLLQETKEISNVLVLPLQPAEKMNFWLNFADIHLLPQKLAVDDLVLPSKLLGILASGKPIISIAAEESELGSIANIAGINVKSPEVDEFVNAVKILSSKAELRIELGNKARQLAVSRFDKKKIFDDFEKEIFKLCY